MILRPYQEEALKRIKEKYHNGIKRQVLVMATGTGKTIIFVKLIDEFIKATGKKVLIICHRQELITQAKNQLLQVNPDLKVGIEKAKEYADHKEDDVIIASTQTLGQTSSERIERFNPDDFCMVIIDEVHHFSIDNKSYTNIIRYFKALKSEPENNTNPLLLLGCTATPQRSDHAGLDKVLDEVVYTYDLLTAIEASWLCRIRAWQVRTTTDISRVSKTAGDFSLGELAEATNTLDRNALILKTYKDLLSGQKTLAFAVDVEHAKELTNLFIQSGIKANYVVGVTLPEERTQRLRDFHNGEIAVMFSVGVLTEGYDHPDIKAILLCRPTQSNILYQQMIGRGTRLAPNKEYLTIIDFVDLTNRQRLITISSILGIPSKIDYKGKDVLTMKEQLDTLLELAPNANLDNLDIDKIKYAIEEVDLLSGLKIPDEISVFTHFDWHRYGEDAYRIGIGSNHSMMLQQSLTGQWILTDHLYDLAVRKETSIALGAWNSLEHGVQATDKYIIKNSPASVALVSDTARWRNLMPSPAQINLLRKFRVNDIILSTLNKGDASRLITKLINNQRRKEV